MWRHLSAALVDAFLGLAAAGVLAAALVGVETPVGQRAVIAIAVLVTVLAVIAGQLIRRRAGERRR